jgi:two-component sensor histidine kinase
MQEFAGFTSIALQMVRSEDRLKAALEEQELLTREMGHRVKNLFAIADGMIRLSARSSDSKEQMAQALSGRLHALAGANALIRRTFSPSGHSLNASNLSEIIAAVLKPYAHAATSLQSPTVQVGEHATNTIAIVFHELATNAAKCRQVRCPQHRKRDRFRRMEDRGRAARTRLEGSRRAADRNRAGRVRVRHLSNTITRHGGTIVNTWRRDGAHVCITLPLSSLTH